MVLPWKWHHIRCLIVEIQSVKRDLYIDNWNPAPPGKMFKNQLPLTPENWWTLVLGRQVSFPFGVKRPIFWFHINLLNFRGVLQDCNTKTAPKRAIQVTVPVPPFATSTTMTFPATILGVSSVQWKTRTLRRTTKKETRHIVISGGFGGKWSSNP